MLDAARATISARDLRINSYTLEVKVVELWASNAEETARLACARAAETEVAAQAAGERAVTAEERAAAAEGRAARAVDDFRRFAAFEDELAEASAGAYLLGFQDGKEKVGRVLGLTGLESIEPDEAPEGLAASSGPARDGPAPIELEPAEDGPAPVEA